MATNDYDLDIMTGLDQMGSNLFQSAPFGVDSLEIKISQHVVFNVFNHLPSDSATARLPYSNYFKHVRQVGEAQIILIRVNKNCYMASKQRKKNASTCSYWKDSFTRFRFSFFPLQKIILWFFFAFKNTGQTSKTSLMDLTFYFCYFIATICNHLRIVKLLRDCVYPCIYFHLICDAFVKTEKDLLVFVKIGYYALCEGNGAKKRMILKYHQVFPYTDIGIQMNQIGQWKNVIKQVLTQTNYLPLEVHHWII